MVFTPALCATYLKPVTGHNRKRGFFGWFNRGLKAITNKYSRGVKSILGHKPQSVAVVLGMFGALIFLFPKLPTAFLPDEDQGTMMLMVQLPPNSTQESTRQVMDQVINYILNEEAQVVDGVLSVSGYSSSGSGQNSGMAFVGLKPYKERQGEGQSAFDLAARIQAKFQNLGEGLVIPMVPPAIEELGESLGFDFYLQDRGGRGHQALMDAKNRFLEMAAAHPLLSMVSVNDMDYQAQYKITIDDQQARDQSLSLSDINNTMSVVWGSAYVNDFIVDGRVKQVYVQGEAGSRIAPEDFKKWYIRNQNGQMVPFSAFAAGEWVMGPPRLERYNGISSMQITGQGAPGVSSGKALARVQELAGQLPPGFGLSFTGLSYEERLAGSQTGQLYFISIIIIFLCLAALYESWSVPVSVMLVVPLGVLGAVTANLLRGLSNDVFFQVGILTVIGLSAKNAILIVEFAKNLYEKQSRTLPEAVIKAAKLRLRPIVMTSLAFIFGVLPMAAATGASSASQHAMGTAVVGGTLSGTCLTLFFVPLFYVLVAGFRKKQATCPADVPLSGTDII